MPLIIPCHRVWRSAARSAPGGSATKIRILELEGVRLGPLEPEQRSLAL